MRKQSGFTLIEVLVACVIVAVLGVGVMLFCQRDSALQERLRVHHWAPVVMNAVSALAQSDVLPLSSVRRSAQGAWQEGPMQWRYEVSWLSRGTVADHLRIRVCEQASQLCQSRVVLRWRYASTS